MMIIEKLTERDIASVMAIELPAEQIKFASTTEEFLASGSETIKLHIIKSDGDVVGFFKLDTAYAEHYDFCPQGAIGLRTFAIDKRCQGKGIGTGAIKALFTYLKTHYTAYRMVYLTVNCKNLGAIACYKKSGFEDTKQLYLGGAAGPQHIMSFALK